LEIGPALEHTDFHLDFFTGGRHVDPAILANYLQQSGAHYEVCAHAHSRTSAETARLGARAPSGFSPSRCCWRTTKAA
jgi:hypothetical protein